MGLAFSTPTPTPTPTADSSAVYRPRAPETTNFYQLLEQHFDDYVYAYQERFEPKAGPLRPVVRRAVEAFLDCGRLQGGFARIRCPTCRSEHLLAFSCQTRNFCPSCQAKRSLLFSEKLTEEILAPVAHRHFTHSIPKALRGLFERERPLLSLVSQTAYESISKSFQKLLDRKDLRPGSVSSIQTFGSFAANWNPHIHSLVTEGGFTNQGEFVPLPKPATSILKDVEERFRRLLLKRLHRVERLSEEFMNKLLQWDPSGFSVHAQQIVLEHEPQRLQRLARYLTRAPIRLDALSETDDGRVQILTPPHPLTGETAVFVDPLDWVHAICQQIPNTGQHLTSFYGAYANRIRNTLLKHTPRKTRPAGSGVGVESEPVTDFDKTCSGSSTNKACWARLIRKVFEVDPLLCPKCGDEMKLIAVVSETAVVDRIIQHLKHNSVSNHTPARAPPQPS